MMHDTLPFEPPPSSRHAGRRQSQGFTVAVQACPMCIKIGAQVGERRSIMQTDNFVKIKTDGAQHNPGADCFTPSRTNQHDAAMYSLRRRWVISVVFPAAAAGPCDLPKLPSTQVV